MVVILFVVNVLSDHLESSGSESAALDDLAPDRILDMASGLRRVASTMGRTPDNVPSDQRWLQPRFAKIAVLDCDLEKTAGLLQPLRVSPGDRLLRGTEHAHETYPKAQCL